MIDVIIPTYKARDLLPQALDSLVCQTKKMFITTIVQDCDDEDYSDIVEDYTRRGLKIRLLKTPENGGPGMARQYGMDKDTMSTYFMFLDADDIMMPRAIEILSREIQANDADLVAGNFISEQAHSPGILMRADSIPCTWTHGKIYRAQYLRDNNIRFLKGLRYNEDSYFNLIVHNCTKKRYTIDEVVYLWRQNPNSLTRAEGIDQSGFFFKSWEMYIRSQVEGMQKILDLTGSIEPTLVAATLVNLYSHEMRAMHYGLNTDLADSYLTKLKKNVKIQEAIDNDKFWKAIVSTLKACVLTNDNTLIFFKQRFPDWMNEHILKERKNERVYR